MPRRYAHGNWVKGQKSQEHITALELKAMRNGLQTFAKDLANSRVRVWTDATVVVSALN
ncbi:hypothetical protein LPJ73_000164, partial [Coemansia sp. RSA 2703]